MEVDSSDLKIAGEFLTCWLPFLTRDLCENCSAALHGRIQSLNTGYNPDWDNPQAEVVEDRLEGPEVAGAQVTSDVTCSGYEHVRGSQEGFDYIDMAQENERGKEEEGLSKKRKLDGVMEVNVSLMKSELSREQRERIRRMSWADMAQENERGKEEEGLSKKRKLDDVMEVNVSLMKSELSREPRERIRRMSWADMAQENERGKEEEGLSKKRKLDDVMEVNVSLMKSELSKEQRERIRFANVGRKKDFVCFERLNGRNVNILEGLELHTSVFSAAEQKRIVDFVYELQEKGRNNEFGEHTYSEPRKWMRGKGRVTIQFGCCYNYAERNGTPAGILRSVMADPIPNIFKIMIKRLIGWHVMPAYCIPDSCIVNIYEPGDCIPPHIDSHDFVRPFCTVSFLSECSILFGSNMKIAGPGDFIGPISIPLPLGSVLVLKGNGADVAKHCVPAVSSKRISITFRKMDKVKWPHDFRLEPDLKNIKPYDLGSGNELQNAIDEGPNREIRTTRRMRSRERQSSAKRSHHRGWTKEHVDLGSGNELQNAIDEGPNREIRTIRRMRSRERHSSAKRRSHHRGWTEEHVDRSFHRSSSNHRRTVNAAI